MKGIRNLFILGSETKAIKDMIVRELRIIFSMMQRKIIINL